MERWARSLSLASLAQCQDESCGAELRARSGRPAVAVTRLGGAAGERGRRRSFCQECGVTAGSPLREDAASTASPLC